MKNVPGKNLRALCLSLLLMTGLSWASENDQQRKKHGPPAEAIEACSDKAEGDVVSFETRKGHTLEGTCELRHETLVAVPEGHKKRHKNKHDS